LAALHGEAAVGKRDLAAAQEQMALSLQQLTERIASQGTSAAGAGAITGLVAALQRSVDEMQVCPVAAGSLPSDCPFSFFRLRC
jgi:hypothetical protein